MTRTAHILESASLTRTQVAEAIGCDKTTVTRLVNGRRETGAQRILLDLLAEKHGLHHLVSAAFDSASPEIPASAGSDVPSRCEAALEQPSLGVSSLTSLAAPGSACGEGFSGAVGAAE